MLVLTHKYGSQIDPVLLKKQKDKNIEPQINHRQTIDLNLCRNINDAYKTYCDNSSSYIIKYKITNPLQINNYVKRQIFKDDVFDASWLDISELNSLQNCFYECKRLKRIIGLETWDVSNIQDMQHMFEECLNLESISDISNWNVSRCNDMSSMFMCCQNIQKLDLSEWRPNLHYARNMFAICFNLETVGDIGRWEMKNCKDITGMFYYCSEIKDIGDITGWDTTNILTADGTFEQCVSLKKIGDLSKWVMFKIKKSDMRNMFKDCGIPTSNIPKWYKWYMHIHNY